MHALTTRTRVMLLTTTLSVLALASAGDVVDEEAWFRWDGEGSDPLIHTEQHEGLS